MKHSHTAEAFPPLPSASMCVSWSYAVAGPPPRTQHVVGFKGDVFPFSSRPTEVCSFWDVTAPSPGESSPLSGEDPVQLTLFTSTHSTLRCE